MKKTKLILMLFLFTLPFSIQANIKEDLIQTGFDALKNPDYLVMDIQYDIENTNPAWEDRFQIQTNLFMNLLTIANLNVKFKLIGESESFPEITIGTGAWYFWGLELLPKIHESLKDVKNNRFFGGVPFVVVDKGFTDTVDLFAGVKCTVAYYSFDFRDVEESVGKGKGTLISPSVYTGMGLKTSETHRLVVQVGYQFGPTRIYAKFLSSGESWEFGLGFYPDSVIIVHPIINYRF